MVYSSITNYWIQQGALNFTLNALDDPDKVSVAVAAGAVIMAYANVNNQAIIDYNAAHNYRAWALSASPTHFERTDKVYVYVRLSKVGDTAMLVYPYEKIPIDPALDSSSSSSSSDGVIADTHYYYIMLGALTPSLVDGSRVNRTWSAEEPLSFGTLDTDEQRNEQSGGDIDRMFRIDSNNVIWTQNNLTFIAGKRLLLLRMSVLGDSTGANTAEITSITKAANINAADFAGVETSLPTTAAMVRYASLLEQLYNSRFLRKDQDDSTPHSLGVGGDLEVGGSMSAGTDASGDPLLEVDDTNKKVNVGADLRSRNFETGFRGWKMDKDGNLEAETGHFRSAIITDELRINRQQAQEGDTIFAENDQIEEVEEVVDGNTTTYILTLKEKWEGYFTAQQYGNIIRGKINTLAAKDAGVSDYTGAEYAASQQQDAGGNKYYTSFMHVIDTHNTNPALGVNQIHVALYGDNLVPMSRNYPPCQLMAIARWGCINYADPSDPHYEDTLRSIKRRQNLFMITTSDGHIVHLVGVDKPILEDYNFGSTLGELPDFVKNMSVASQLIAGRDYLYAQGTIVGDFIKIDIHGKPVVNYVGCGEWIDGNSNGTVIIPVYDAQIDDYVDTEFPLPIPSTEYEEPNSPYVGYGIYICDEKNPKNLRVETHEVMRFGIQWRALMHQPVVSGGVATFNAPSWESNYWKAVGGDMNYYCEIISSAGTTFRNGNVNTILTMSVSYGQEDITDRLLLKQGTTVEWTRKTGWDEQNQCFIQTPEDREWQSTPANNGKSIVLVRADMGSGWMIDYRQAMFCCAIYVPEGNGRRVTQYSAQFINKV